MGATAFANTLTSSLVRQFFKIVLLSTVVVTACGSLRAQTIAVVPARLALPKITVGTTSSSKVVTITNKGASSQPVNLVVSGDFSETDNCGGNLAAGQSCKANVTFTPTMVGAISGAVSIYDNSDNLLALVGLTGTGVAPVSTTPTSLAFTGGTIGTESAAKTFQIVNNSSSTVNITGITTSVTDYQINTGTCLTMSLAPAGSCTVSVQVTPSSVTDDGAIIVTDDVPNSTPLVVKLTSAATGAKAPISLNKTSLKFAVAAGGTSAAQTVTVTNASQAVVALGTITASADYAISNTTCSSSLAVKGKCTISIEFQPTFVGTIEGTVAVPFTTSSGNSPLVVNLTGTSESPLTASPAKLSFASQSVGTVGAVKSATVTNNTSSAVTLNSVVASGDFLIAAGSTTCPLTGGTLAANSSCGIGVEFAPTAVGSIVGALTISNNANPNPLLISLAGTGTAAQPSFTLSAAPTSVSIAQGGSGTSTITVNPVNGFNGSVSLAVTSTLPSGVTASFNPTATSSTSVLTLTASATATVGGPVTVTITGTSGSLTQTTTVSLTVTAAPSFTLSAAPTSVTVVQGGSGTSTITVNPMNGFNGSVSLAVTSTLPSGVTASFNPTATSSTSVLTLTASATATVGGPVTVTITGTSGSLTQTTTVSLTVTAAPSFTLSAAPTSLSIAEGSSGTSTITVNPLNGFNGSVSLAVTSTLPSGVTASFNPTATSSTSVLTLTASATATVGGPVTVTITGTSGSLTQTTTVSLTVTAAPSFTLSAAPTSVTVVQGGSGTSTITVNPMNGFNGSVSLAVTSTLPTGVTASFNPTATSSTSVLTLTASATATVGGPVTVTITGTSGSLTQTTTVSLTVTAAPSFTLSAAPTSVTVVQGGSGTSTITVNPMNGFNGSVSLAVTSTLPTGVTASFNPTATSSTSVLTLTASATATVGGPVTVTITGTSGSLTQTTTVSLTVTAAPSFTLSAAPTSVTVVQGGSGTSTITVNPMNGFNGSVSLAVTSTLPTGVTASFNPTATSSTSVLTLTASATATVGGPVTVTITGTSGSLTQTTTVSLTVTAAPSFTLSAAPTSVTVVQGGSGTSTITVNPMNGFNGSVSLAVTSTLPTGVTASFNPTATSSTSVLTLTASATATVGGPVTVTITGTSGSLTQTTTVSLTVTAAPSFTLSAAPTSVTVVQGGSGTSTITVNPMNGFNGSVSLAVTSTLPTGVTASFNPTATSSTSVLTLTASATATVGGPVTVTITGTSGSLTQTTTVSLTVTAAPSFTLSAAPTSLSIAEGSSGTSTITVNPLNGFNGSVSLAVTSTLPSGVTASFNPTATSTTSVVTLTASATATKGGPTTVTITGTSGSLTQTTTINLTVTAPTATLSASSAHQGSSETIVITGAGTSFGASTTVNFGSDITTGTVVIYGPQSASVPITIDNVAALGARSVTITTGSKVVTATFTVLAGVPAVTAISPNMVAPTGAQSVSLTGVFTNWTSGTTTANFGPGISVGGAPAGKFGPVTASGGTSLTANITPSNAANGFRTVQIQTGSQNLVINNGVYVGNCTTNAPSVVQVSPPNNATNAPVNTQVQVQFSVPMNSADFTLKYTGTVFFADNANPTNEVPATLSLDATGTIATIAPTAALAAGDTFILYLSNANPFVQDACGNILPAQQYTFTTAFNIESIGPSLTGTSPVNGDTHIPISGIQGATPVVLQFNEPIDPITAQYGFVMLNGSTAVSGNFTYSTNDAAVTFTPSSPLTANTTYTVTYNSQITDAAGNSLTNPSSFTFTTGSGSDANAPAVVLVDPPNGSTGVGLNATPHVTFSEPVDGLSVAGALNLVYQDTGVIVPSTVTVANNRLSAAITPSAPLLPNTYYVVSLPANSYTDIAGNGGLGSSTAFFTGGSAVTNPLTVGTIIPGNGQAGVPLNTEVVAVISNNVDPTSISNSSITVTPNGGSAIGGTVSLATDGVTLTFVPSAALTASTVYNVAVSGFTDVDGNAVSAFTSSFTTGTGTYGGGSFSVVSTSPVSGATNVAVTSPVTFTMTNLIDAASVNPNTVYVAVSNGGQVVTGTYSGSGNAVTFTPLTQYPGNTLMSMAVCNLMDEAGNTDCQSFSFTTASTLDQTPPTVSITPANGATNIGLNTQIVLTFSKSINPTTVNPNTVNLFSGDVALNFGYTISRDNRTVVLNPAGNAFAPGATIAVELSGIQDLSGNALAITESTFSMTTALPNTQPSVTAMRPGNGATGVPTSTVITLFTSAPMNPATIPGALHVTDNTVMVQGTVQLFSNGQAIEFTPSSLFGAGDTIQVYMDSTALSADGIPVQSFAGSFTAVPPARAVAVVLATNPQPLASNVPLNTVVQIQYNETLASGSITSSSVALEDVTTSTFLTPTLSLVGSGQVINIAPTGNLVAGHKYSAFINYQADVTNTKGTAVEAYELDFTAGSAADNAAPTISSLAPTNNSTVGTNALLSVNFNKAINPVSVTGSTIQLSAGSQNEVPASITFAPDFARVTITPITPLPPSTPMTVTINGVTSVAGVAVAKTITNFTTQAQPDFNAPYVVNPSVQNGQTGVPVNAVFSMQFSKPMDVGSVDGSTAGVFSAGCGVGQVPATVSWSADLTTISIVPTSVLAVGGQYYLYSDSLTDLAGNLEQDLCNSFTTSFSTNTNPPAVVNTSPENSEAQVPLNAPVEILFNEPINPTSVGQVTLTTGGNSVAATATFGAANQVLMLTPSLPLLPNASYTLTITGVKDTAGNKMTATVTNTFTTSSTFDVVQPSVVLADPPAGSIGVGTNVAPRLVFSGRLNPLSVVSSGAELYYNGAVQLYNYATGQWVPATVSMSADRLTATITPQSALQPSSQYVIYAGVNAPYYDVAGNAGVPYSGSFWTGLGSDTTHASVSTVSPSNGQTGAPLNAQIVAVMSDQIDPTSVTNNSIAVIPAGGNAISGTVGLASDGVTLTFVPGAALNPSTVYNVWVAGFNDVQGNSVSTFTSSFTTGTSAFGSGTFTVVSTNPSNGATSVPVTSPVTFTMSNLVDVPSVNANTVEVRVVSNQDVVTGTYSVSGAVITFTPLTQYPGSTQMGMYLNGVMDEAGNSAAIAAGTFTTAATVDHTAPTVTITPANGTTNVGLNTQVVLTFSKSINPATISSASANLLNGDVSLNPAISISRDNRTVVLNYNGATLPAGATITVAANSLITDLSGNALANTTSQFTTTSATANNAPYVVSMRPGNGATGVAGNTVITLFTSRQMNAGSLPGALHVSQNGVLISGTTSVGSNGQSVEFTPSSGLSAAAAIQVVLDSTAQDIYSNYLQYFTGAFTVAGSLTNTPAQVQVVNPFPNAPSVPLNTIIQVEYNQPLNANTINNNSVVLYQYSTGTYLTPTLSLSSNGQVITITPPGNLVAGSGYYAIVSHGANIVTNIDGVPVQQYQLNFTAGTSTDTAGPTVVTVAPPNSTINIGTNAAVSVDFSKAVNPVSVTGSSIQLSGGSVTEVPASISFTPDFARTMIVPQAPLPSSTQMAIAINGVTAIGGGAVTSQTTHFTTMAGADFVAPAVINSSVLSGQVVGTNASFAMQFNKPIDLGSVDGAAVGVSSFVCGAPAQLQVPATISWSADQTTVFIVPTGSLNTTTTYYLFSYSLSDLAGNSQQNFCVTFSTGSGTQTTRPAVKQVNPPIGFTGVPINAPVQILCNEPISGASLGGVTLKQSGTVVPTTVSLYDGDQGIQLLPLAPLAGNTTYTINVTGVVDINGNTQTTFASQSFTTGTGTDFVTPTVVSTTPASGATHVAGNTTVQVVFNEAMDPASFDPNNSFSLHDPSNNVVAATITFSTDYKTVTLHPNATLTGGGATYTMYVGSGSSQPLQDLGGNAGGNTSFSFSTQ